ncbi:MAG: hypothetical protein QW043_02100, partial [Desulfurococcaceae archaeon]
FNKLQLSPLEFLIYRTLVDAGFNKAISVNIATELTEKIKNKVSVPGWAQNPKLYKDVEKDIALAVLKAMKSTNIRMEQSKMISLIKELIEKVKSIESK